MEFIDLITNAFVDNKTGETSVRQVSEGQCAPRKRDAGLTQLLPESGVDINPQDENHLDMAQTHLQPNFSPSKFAKALLDHGANVNAGGRTSFYQELEGEYHI